MIVITLIKDIVRIEQNSMDRLVETARQILSSSDILTIRSMTSALFAWFSEHRRFVATLLDTTKSLHLSADSFLWSILTDATKQRLRRIRRDVEAFRLIVQCRAISFAVPSEHSTPRSESHVYDIERLLVPRVGLTATYEIVDDTQRILRETANYLIERSAPLRTIFENIQRIESDIREMSRTFREMISAIDSNGGDTSGKVVVDDVDPSSQDFKSIDRSNAEQRSLALQSSIFRLNELLSRAPTEAQIRLREKLAYMQDIYEREEIDIIESWTKRELFELETISRLTTTRDAVRRLWEAAQSIEKLRDTVQRAISRETREILSLRDTLKNENDRLEETGQNAYHRILHELQIIRRNDSGSTKLEQREKDYVREKITTSGIEGDDSTVAINSIAMRQWQRNFCETTCNILLEHRRAGTAHTLETNVNRTRDRLTAFLYRYGDNVFLRDLRKMAKNNNWSNPRAALLPEKRSPLSSWQNRNTETIDKLRDDRKDTYDRFFSIDWSLLSRVNSSAINAILNIFEIRYSFVDDEH